MGPSLTFICPALDPPQGRNLRQMSADEYSILVKFNQNAWSGSIEEVENVKSLRWTDGRRMDDTL